MGNTSNTLQARRACKLKAARCAGVLLLALIHTTFAGARAAGVDDRAASPPPSSGDATSGVAAGNVNTPATGQSDTSPLPPPPPGSPPPSQDPRSLEGIWLAEGGGPGGPNAPGGVPVYTPAAEQQADYRRAMIAKGTPVGTNPTRCRPMGPFRLGADLFPMEVAQTPDEVVLFNEEGRTRWDIHLNRNHPKHVALSYWGDSVGHWEGNTLVVDTIGLKGDVDWVMAGPSTHIVSRLRKLGDGRQLELTMHVEDPGIYQQPFDQRTVSVWHPELQILEFQCEENPNGAKQGAQ